MLRCALVHGADICQPRRSRFASFSRKGNTLYMHVHHWPGDTVVLLATKA